MQGTIRVLGNGGDTAVKYDTDAGIVEEAEKVLAEANAHGSGLFDGTTKEQIPNPARKGGDPRKVLSEHEEVLIVPPMAGG